MNTLSIKITYYIIFISTLITLSFSSCKKKEYIYEVNDESITKEGVNKSTLKNNTEFISMVYSDLYGTTIPNAKLTNLSLEYDACGDKELIEDLIIRNLLNDPSVQLPTKIYMDNNLDAFIDNTYKKFFNRTPNEMELWNLKRIIQEDASITPEMVYYSFLTSDEYRFY